MCLLMNCLGLMTHVKHNMRSDPFFRCILYGLPCKDISQKSQQVDLHGRVPPLFLVLATISSRNEALDGRNLAQADPKLDTR